MTQCGPGPAGVEGRGTDLLVYLFSKSRLCPGPVLLWCGEGSLSASREKSLWQLMWPEICPWSFVRTSNSIMSRPWVFRWKWVFISCTWLSRYKPSLYEHEAWLLMGSLCWQMRAQAQWGCSSRNDFMSREGMLKAWQMLQTWNLKGEDISKTKSWGAGSGKNGWRPNWRLISCQKSSVNSPGIAWCCMPVWYLQRRSR